MDNQISTSWHYAEGSGVVDVWLMMNGCRGMGISSVLMAGIARGLRAQAIIAANAPGNSIAAGIAHRPADRA